MDVMNWREFAPGLYSAGQPTPNQWSQIREAGVVAVLNLRPDDEQPGIDEGQCVEQAGLRYQQLPVANGDALDQACVDAFAGYLAEHPQGGVLVHCGSGNRVGALVALWARRHLGATLPEALQAGRRAGLSSLEPKVVELLEVI